LRLLARGSEPVTLGGFLRETGLELADVYSGNKSWSDLRSDAGIRLMEAGPNEGVLRRACGRLLHIDDLERLDMYRNLLSAAAPPALEEMSERSRRLVRMLVASVADRAVDKSA